MAYLTRADVKARLPRQWQTLFTTAGAVDETLIDAAIAGAEAEVNGYLAKRYSVPVTVGLDLVKNWSLTLVEEQAYANSANAELPKKVSERLAAVRKALRDVADGRLTLGTVTEPEPAPDAAGSCVIVEGNTPEFTREKMAGF